MTVRHGRRPVVSLSVSDLGPEDDQRRLGITVTQGSTLGRERFLGTFLPFFRRTLWSLTTTRHPDVNHPRAPGGVGRDRWKRGARKTEVCPDFEE